MTCTFSIECSTILNNWDDLKESKAEFVPYYVSGINNLYEFDCGKDSGWMYCVNGWYPNYGCSKYTLEDGDTVEWRYTCNLGRDVGDQYYD